MRRGVPMHFCCWDAVGTMGRSRMSQRPNGFCVITCVHAYAGCVCAYAHAHAHDHHSFLLGQIGHWDINHLPEESQDENSEIQPGSRRQVMTVQVKIYGNEQ